MSREENVAPQWRAVEHLNSGDIDSAMELFAADAIDRDPAPGQSPGREGFREFFRALASAFPDAHFQPAHLVADDDHVCVAYTITATHKGPFQSIAATNKRIEVRGVQIGRFENAQIVERWGSTDELGIMQQIGAIPVSGGTQLATWPSPPLSHGEQPRSAKQHRPRNVRD
jgi:steroid delta-isomerase-like uncharacterized protein